MQADFFTKIRNTWGDNYVGTLEEALNKPYCGTLNATQETTYYGKWYASGLKLAISHLNLLLMLIYACMATRLLSSSSSAQALVVMIIFFFLHEAASASLLGAELLVQSD